MSAAPLVIAPEQAAGEPQRIGPHTDIYSLGIILYWMLCGRPPFIADAPGRLMLMHIKDEPTPLQEKEPSVHDDVAWVVHQCLAKEPEDRPSSARAVYQAFASATKWDGKLVEASIEGAAPEGGSPTIMESAHDDPTVIRGSESGEEEGNATTISGATGEASHTAIVEPKAQQRRLRLLALAIAVISLVAVGLVMLESRHPTKQTRAPAASPPVSQPPAKEQAKAPPPAAKPDPVAPDAGLASAVDAATEPVATAEPKKRRARRKRRKAAATPTPPVETKAPATKDEPPAKKAKPRKIGEGTMEVDL